MLGPLVVGLQVLALIKEVQAGVYGPVNRIVHPESFGKRQLIPSATWGPDITLGQTASEFTTLSTIYTTGPPPAQVKGSIFLWPGLFDQANRNAGDLVQSVVELHDAKSTKETCQAKPGQWFVAPTVKPLFMLKIMSRCIRPFVVNYKAKPMSNTPKFGKAIDPGDKILIQYAKAAGPDGKWNQKITNLSKGNAVLFDYPAGHTPTRWYGVSQFFQPESIANIRAGFRSRQNTREATLVLPVSRYTRTQQSR